MPRSLKNLEKNDEIQNLSCITDMKIQDLTNEGKNSKKINFFQGNSQIYALCAAGSRSSLRILKHGLKINQMALS